MPLFPSQYDYVIIGAGSAGCAVAGSLIERDAGSVLLIEAGPSNKSALVKMPFALVWLMGSKRRDWCFKSAPQKGLNNRVINIPRGRMVGGSGSINSMVWFRGRRADFDDWNVDGWRWHDVEPAFAAVESYLQPRRLMGAHPLSEALGTMLRGNGEALPSPEYESAGVFQFNLHDGKRHSAADAFLNQTQSKQVSVLTNCQVSSLALKGSKAHRVIMADGTSITAHKGIILSAGSIGSPEILMRSGFGPSEDLKSAKIDVVMDLPEVGANLHDHPGCGLHYYGSGSGYGIDASHVFTWALAPFAWAFYGTGVFASPMVEAGAFFNAANDGGEPDIQSHFIPFMLDWRGRKYAYGSGYFADACVCRPKSRGALRVTPSGVSIDLGIFNDKRDLDLMIKGLKRLRVLMDGADFGARRAVEAYPGPSVQTEDEFRDHVKNNAATAYHPVGTLRMGAGDAPVSARLKFKGVEGLWVADASVMPQVTSANTNAPSMMIGYRAGQMITEDAA